MFDPERIRDAEARYRRFPKLFKAQARLWDLVNVLLDQEGAKFRVRDGAEHDLSLLVGASLGKAMKSFEAVHELCLKGWGEDALILLRSNVNLLINLGYILGDDEPVERATDFIAHSYRERVKYLKAAHDASPPWKSSLTEEESEDRAKRWDSVKIKERADRVPKFHYSQGYKLYSSIEHSDAVALNGYIAEWNEVGPRINAGPGDDYIEVALGHNVMVLADIVMLYLGYFKIDRPDLKQQLRDLVESINLDAHSG
jgi:hypothetical protein